MVRTSSQQPSPKEMQPRASGRGLAPGSAPKGRPASGGGVRHPRLHRFPRGPLAPGVVLHPSGAAGPEVRRQTNVVSIHSGRPAIRHLVGLVLAERLDERRPTPVKAWRQPLLTHGPGLVLLAALPDRRRGHRLRRRYLLDTGNGQRHNIVTTFIRDRLYVLMRQTRSEFRNPSWPSHPA